MIRIQIGFGVLGFRNVRRNIKVYNAYFLKFWFIPIGSFDLTSENGLITERASLLPVMKALLKVMETNKPAPEDINTLMVLTRDLLDRVPEGEGLPSLKVRTNQLNDRQNLSFVKDEHIWLW